MSTHVESIKGIPIRVSDCHWAQISELVQRIAEQQDINPHYPNHAHEQREIDGIVYDLYDVGPLEITEVDLWYCRRYPTLADAQGVFEEMRGVELSNGGPDE